METTDLYITLSKIFQDIFDDETLVLMPELTASEVDEWDSLNHIRLILSVEKRFGVKFSAAEVAKLKNVGEFVTLIQSKL